MAVTDAGSSNAWSAGQGDIVQRLRLISGLVLFAFALLHFLNHALGAYSVGLMEAVQEIRVAAWRSWPGTALLAGSALIHVVLALYKTARRRTVRMPAWEVVQLFLGLCIPYYLIQHLVATRGTHEVFGLDDTYTHELSILWRGNMLTQSVLLLLVWVHGVIGIHYWLRIRPWYPRLFPILLSLAVFIPAIALWGFVDGARRLWLLGQDVGFFTEEQTRFVADNTTAGRWILLVLLILVIGAVVVWRIRRALGAGLSISYPGNLVVRSTPGSTLLEISRENGVPHASVCGGRARCSTCRTKIIDGLDSLPTPDANEKAVLERIRADSDVRLACQIRPSKDLNVRPLLPARETGRAAARVADAYYWGVEQVVAVMFVDIRGFTTLSEQRLTYDIVYVLNRYFTVMTQAIEGAGGYIDKFIGDGIMAIFGMTSGANDGSRQALAAAVRIDKALAELNDELDANLESPLRIGIGIHAGPVILGRIGAVGSEHIAANITALGDTVNTASRLESLTKEHGARLIVSEAVLKAAGVGEDDAGQTDVAVRGRKRSLKASVFMQLDDLEELLAETDVGNERRGESSTPVSSVRENGDSVEV